MSFEASQFRRTGSPALPGRSSPVDARGRVEDDGPAKPDKAIRRYAAGIERALTLFDSALQDWADYLPFLGRLLKALQVHPPGISDVPHKALVAQRLSQCLHPALPSGVHQKALEVYTYIFSLIGKEGLGRDLPHYLPGLSPVLSFASLSTKPSLLAIFDTFIVTLDPVALRPALKAILLALLPGLEEESSEEFERTLGILQRLKGAISCSPGDKAGAQDASGHQLFWQCLFLATITSPSRRQGALAYLQRHLPRLGRSKNPKNPDNEQSGENNQKILDEIEAVTSPEPGLLIRCFAAGLSDSQVLIQRGFLDMLVTHLPLHSEILHRKIIPSDLVRLTKAAVSVVLRREMSLNRRLWTWFLGSKGPSSDNQVTTTSSKTISTDADRGQGQQIRYFQQNGLSPLVRGIMEMLEGDALTAMEKARPFRVALALMDRWEIGSLVVPVIFLPALKSVWRYQSLAATPEEYSEVLRSASAFFDGIESSLIWEEISNKLLHAPEMQLIDYQSFREGLELASFVITNFNLQEEEMLVRHIPLLALSLLLKFRTLLDCSQDEEGAAVQDVAERTLHLTGQLLNFVPRRAFETLDPKEPNLPSISGEALNVENQAFISSMKDQYKAGVENPQSKASVIDKAFVARLFLLNMHHLVVRELSSCRISRFFETEIATLEKLLRRTPAIDLPFFTELLSGIQESSQNLAAQHNGFPKLKGIILMVSLLETVREASLDNTWLDDYRLRLILPDLITGLWPFLSPASSKTNVEAVRCLWKVQYLSTDKKLLESCISALMLESPLNREGIGNIENARRFGILWSHSNNNYGSHARRSSLVPSARRTGSALDKAMYESVLARPLLLLLDVLEDSKTELFTFAAGWLQSSTNVQVIVEFLQQRLQVTQNMGVSGPDTTQTTEVRQFSVDVDECLYYLRTLMNVVEHSPHEIWPSLLAPPNSNSQGDIPAAKEKRSQAGSDESGSRSGTATTQTRLIQICLEYLSRGFEEKISSSHNLSRLQQTAVSFLEELVLRSTSLVDTKVQIESPILSALSRSIRKPDQSLQISLMSLVAILLRRRLGDTRRSKDKSHHRVLSDDHGSERTLSRDTHANEDPYTLPIVSSPVLLDCLFEGLASMGSQPVLRHWIRFLDSCLPYYMPNIFQILMPLVDRLVKALEQLFQDLQSSFEHRDKASTATVEPVNTMIELLNGLEQILARAHDCLTEKETVVNNTKAPETAQGFFGNMVSGVLPSDIHKSRSAGANNRLTVLLCFKDAVKLCLRIWSWGSGPEISHRDPTLSSSFNHTTLRLKNRSRRILEHLFAAESLECLETLVYSWQDSRDVPASEISSPIVLDLLHVLDGSRPRNTIPAIFNALYSRTNPGALDPDRKSTLTSELSDIDIARFLVEYTRSLEDDAMDEIWTDCMTFLKDVLTNPLPHRQILPKLLEFTALLGIKVDNTNFGDNRKRRRELADLFLRQLTATITTKPLSFPTDPPPSQSQKLSNGPRHAPGPRNEAAGDDIVCVLAVILPHLSKVLVDSDRITTALNTISTQVSAPTLRWKSFPRNVTPSFLDLWLSMARITEASKVWRKDVAEAFNDSRFFCEHSYELAPSRWLPLLREWISTDKGRVEELLSRIPSPTSAGIVFGVGASSARLEADRRTQLNLRRVATLLLAAPNDSLVVHIGAIQEKITDLLNATAASSPSSATRAEIYVVLRSLILKNLPVHLVSLWPSITTELHAALSSLYPSRSRDRYNMHCVVHACKLLDILLAAAPDDFQMRQWLFITDTIDAVYRPEDLEPHAIVDDLIDDLDATAGTHQSVTIHAPSASQTGSRKPLLMNQTLRGIPKEKLLDRGIRPFLRQLSINTFENTYSMTDFDWQAAYEDLLFDIFDDKTLV